VREGKGWEEKKRGKEGEGTGREGKNVLPHSKQAVAAYGSFPSVDVQSTAQ